MLCCQCWPISAITFIYLPNVYPFSMVPPLLLTAMAFPYQGGLASYLLGQLFKTEPLKQTSWRRGCLFYMLLGFLDILYIVFVFIILGVFLFCKPPSMAYQETISGNYYLLVNPNWNIQKLAGPSAALIGGEFINQLGSLWTHKSKSHWRGGCLCECVRLNLQYFTKQAVSVHHTMLSYA